MFANTASFPFLTPRRIAAAVALASAALALGGCGGGSRAADYKPSRMVSFGDENSTIESYAGALKDSTGAQGTMKGLVYTVNTVASTTLVCADSTSPNFVQCATSNGGTLGTVTSTDYLVFSSANIMSMLQHDGTNQMETDVVYSCTSSNIWIQVVAHDFHLGYSSYNGSTGLCPTDAYAGAVSYATFGAKAADVVTQINSHLGELDSSVLVTVMAGQNDILELFDQVKAGSITQASAEAELKNRAASLAAAIKAIMGTGAKVVLALTPDLGESPYAYQQTDANRAILSDLLDTFNNYLYVNELGTTSGRLLAGVNPETYTDPNTRSSTYTYNAAVCPMGTTTLTRPDGTSPDASEITDYSAVKYCNSYYSTLNGSTSYYVWADQIHYAPLGHTWIGSAAYSRASDQF
jgi:phospholipase/lecithinase/hemolysin